jgi:hypothetical protein
MLRARVCLIRVSATTALENAKYLYWGESFAYGTAVDTIGNRYMKPNLACCGSKTTGCASGYSTCPINSTCCCYEEGTYTRDCVFIVAFYAWINRPICVRSVQDTAAVAGVPRERRSGRSAEPVQHARESKCRENPGMQHGAPEDVVRMHIDRRPTRRCSYMIAVQFYCRFSSPMVNTNPPGSRWLTQLPPPWKR